MHFCAAEAPSQRAGCHRVDDTAIGMSCLIARAPAWIWSSDVLSCAHARVDRLSDMLNASVDAVNFNRVSTTACRRNFIGLHTHCWWHSFDRSEENPPAGLLLESCRTRTQVLLIQMRTPDQGDMNSCCTVPLAAKGL